MMDDEMTKIVVNGICKGILYIGIIVLFGFWLSNCNLNSKVIIQCEESCSSMGSHMESVTSSKCICTKKDSISVSPFVLPVNN